MNLNMTWGELARAAGGRVLRGDASSSVSAIATDTRVLADGQAFWALKGPRFDAHDLLADKAKSAAGWVVEEGRLSAQAAAPPHVVSVPDTLKALQALAAHHRRRFEIPVAGITGSNGKTTTKEMLGAICRQVGPTCVNPGNWNNQVGLPLSLLELDATHRYAIFEMGASKPGDIAELSRIAQPTMAVLTNIAPAHIEFFGSLEATFRAKIELLEGLPEDGRVAYNIDDPWLSGLEQRLGARGVPFGLSPKARVRFESDDSLLIDRHRITVSLHAFGNLSRLNAAAAAAAAWAMGISPQAIRDGLQAYRPSAMRLEPRRHASGCDLILDAYNANPGSMRAAIEAFCQRYAGERKILVLGDMKELGTLSAQYHRELGEWLRTLPLTAVYLAGKEMRAAYEALASGAKPFECHHADVPDAWEDALKKDLAPATAALFKASRAMKFEDLAAKL